MAITTWLTLDERKNLTKINDKDVNELYQEVRAIKPTIYIQETPYRVGNIFKRKWISVYTIYHALDNIDVQVINLFGLGGPYSKEVVMGFLVGCLTPTPKPKY
jgi:hypothetical protein